MTLSIVTIAHRKMMTWYDSIVVEGHNCSELSQLSSPTTIVTIVAICQEVRVFDPDFGSNKSTPTKD